ncbi:TPA: hypothetical protein P9G65_004913 [Pseudomonas aeruginosa]|nr:hypothetical protein [Pseudomonas aeruginosa]HDQ4722646.1 hypothetical protein [Pseudomonas aeruginosa]
MADITKPVAFTKQMQELINDKLADPSFTHENWNDPDLLEVRSHIRAHYRKVQFGYCAFCRKDVSLQSAMNCHVEHIAPKSLYRNFIFEPKNLCVICADCNQIKRDQEVLRDIPDTLINGSKRVRYPRAESAFLIVQPHFMNYEQHIEEFSGFYVDLTEEGHFTIGACVLNRRIREFGWEKPYDDAEISEIMNNYLELTDSAARSRALKILKKLLIFV